MSDLQIIRPRLAFEREFGQHRNWWVRDPRIAGNALSIYLFLLSHDEKHPITQTEAQRALGLGKDAWRAAKERLLKAGFFAEIRDRYPEGYADEHGPRGGQKRFRLILQDPEPGQIVSLEDAIIELDEPYESSVSLYEELDCGLSAVQQSSTADNPQWLAKPLISPTADYPHTGTPTADYPQSFIGREEGLVRLGFNNQPNQTFPTIAREAIDAELRELLPSVQPPLTLAAIEREVDGRVDLSGIDVVQAVTDTVLKAKVASKPAAYVAAVLVRKPESWLFSAIPLAPGSFIASAEDFAQDDPSPREARAARAAMCAAGDHDWGPSSWTEIDRAHCLPCGASRRDLDPVFRELQDEHDRFKFGKKVS